MTSLITGNLEDTLMMSPRSQVTLLSLILDLHVGVMDIHVLRALLLAVRRNEMEHPHTP